MNLHKILIVLCLICGGIINSAWSQISPGDLCNAHAHLEGISNCTKCHDTGNKVTREKCLSCHKDIQQSITNKHGYHASTESLSKNCVVCHNDHHGKEFKIIRFDKKFFDHNKSGFELKGVHAKKDCNACHKPEFISNDRLKKKSTTYLGLKSACLTCHTDFHQAKLDAKCNTCHSFESFKNATGFDHSKTHFPLLGKHKGLQCISCHKTIMLNGHKAQNFDGLVYNNCTGCHTDVHKNKFGQNCKQCHTEESFHFNQGMKAFDHDKTNFKLIGKHLKVDCKQCHKTTLTAPLKHDKCSNCHSDYHKGDFVKNGAFPDCKVCHTNAGFTPSTFSLEQHNKTRFKLEGAHMATACMACHKQQKDWKFSKMGLKCVECHTNVHKGHIEDKFMPDQNCTLCHNVKTWKAVQFDHNTTGYKLEYAHAKTSCASCHYRKNDNGIKTQVFEGTSRKCSSCHKDSHMGQFEVDGQTKCIRCHGTDDFHKTIFDHDTSRFKLDGAHKNVKCNECHKPIMNEKGKYIQYKFKNIDCATCHA